jgi:DNA-binding CsgD family transcriptional regulator
VLRLQFGHGDNKVGLQDGLLRDAIALAECDRDRDTVAAAELWLGRLAIFAGDEQAAALHLARALTLLESLRNPLGRVRALALIGLLEAVIIGRNDVGESKLRAAAELAHTVSDSWGQGYADMMLSICAADRGDHRAVQEHAARALATASIAPLHPVAVQQLARVAVERDPGLSLRLLGAADALLRRDGTEEPAFLARRAGDARRRAEQLVGAPTAVRLYEEGMLLGRAEVHELLNAASVRALPLRPGGLSRRELQVATLVARLHSNRDIARTLFISVRTAESHVEHILAKLNLANRQELAAWAIAHGLPAETYTDPNR